MAIYNNKKALVQLNNGIKDSAKGQVKFIEDFSKYLEEFENLKVVKKHWHIYK
ncbi:MAG: hypothetical protein LN589_00165 [Rickettsia endosymbiont of Eriopis connexa]|nr:hypothetical protein [Rickettsia endosymbiont of Eriopis connexa]